MIFTKFEIPNKPVMDYIDILRDWERTVANVVIYDNIDVLFPAYGFVRMQSGGPKDHWASPLKIDLTRPKTPSREKTVVGAADLKFREQGDWDNAVSVIDRLMDEYSLGSIFEVYRYIADRFNLDMPTSTGYGAGNPEKERRIQLLEFLEDYFVWNIENNSGAACGKARSYLEGRGFTKEWIKALRFGFVPGWDKVEAYVTRSRWRFTREELEQACRVRSDDGYTTVGRTHVLAIPYRCGGELKGFLFRAVESGIIPKYKANTGLERKSTFFNIQDNRDPKDIIVVEGEMDALTATAAGIKDVVAIGGSDISGERRSQVFDAIGRRTRKIVLCLDLDRDADGKPGYEKRFKAVRRSLHTIFDVSPDFNRVFVARFPYPADPNEFIRDNGADAFRELISGAIPWWEYLDRYLSVNG